MKLLKRYWIKLKRQEGVQFPPGTVIGCGVSARDYQDAILLLDKKIFKGNRVLEIEEYIENVDISILDKGHVIPNMGDPTVRGIWFPLGY